MLTINYPGIFKLIQLITEYLEILIFLDGSADNQLIGRLRVRSDIGRTNKNLRFSEKMYCLEKELKNIEEGIRKIDDEIEIFEKISMSLTNSLSGYIKNDLWINYLIEKQKIKINKKLLKMFEMHRSVKQRMRKLLPRSEPVQRSIIIYQRIEPRRKK
jgi:hypothetical protein